MDKESFKDKVKECEDAIITYRSTNSRKLKYNVCTLNFTTPYIQKKHNNGEALLSSESNMSLLPYLGAGLFAGAALVA